MTDKNEIHDTLKAANLYLDNLKHLELDIETVISQIDVTSKEAKSNIENTFDKLIGQLCEILCNRRNELINEVEKIKTQSVAPLQECQQVVTKKVAKTEKLIGNGEILLNGALGGDISQFSETSSFLGSLPEIPKLKEVPYISLQWVPKLESELLDLCANLGRVSKMAPVQISRTVQKPGAILVEWHFAELEEYAVDIEEFRLQRAFGNVNIDKHLVSNFSDCFKGVDNHFLVKDLQVGQPYSFRVCCRFEGADEWSAWSVPQVGTTLIKAFSWQRNPHFELADNNRIATPVSNNPSVLISDGPQYSVGHSVEFTFLECDGDKCTIGLVASKTPIDSLRCNTQSYFALESTGEIIVDHQQRSTKLPPIVKGTKVTITSDKVLDNKVRVNMDSEDKRVTYDWSIPCNHEIYFAVQFTSPSNKIMVE